jgi:hypothetical protein
MKNEKNMGHGAWSMEHGVKGQTETAPRLYLASGETQPRGGAISNGE